MEERHVHGKNARPIPHTYTNIPRERRQTDTENRRIEIQIDKAREGMPERCVCGGGGGE